jgi:hypothetical protein
MTVTSRNEVNLVNPDGALVNWPMTSGSDGGETAKTPIFLANKIPPGYQFQGSGCSDKWEAPAEIAGGALFQLSRTDQGTADLAFGWLDHVYLMGGFAKWKGAEPGDWLRCTLYTPASTYTVEDPGSPSQGIVPYDLGGGACMLIPSATPTHYVDLSRYTGTEVDKAVVPVPAHAEGEEAGNGWWDWSATGGVVANPTQTGLYNLFSFPINMWQHVAKMPLLGEGCYVICPEEMKPKKLLPTWRIKAEVHRETTGTVDAAWFIYIARKRSFIQ